MMTTSGIVAPTMDNFPQLISELGKPAIIINRTGSGPADATQAMMLRQYGIAANQPSLTNFCFEAKGQNERNVTSQNRLSALRSNILYTSAVPVHSSSQMFNGGHINEISSQPQIRTTQASGTLLNQAHLLGLQVVRPSQPGLSWVPSGLQFSQNPIIIYNQPADMTFQQVQPHMAMHMPPTATAQTIPSTSFGSAIVAPRKQKLVKLIPKKKHEAGATSDGSPPSNSLMTTTLAQMDQAQSTPVARQKSVADNKICPKPVQDSSKSTGMENKPLSGETKIFAPQKSQAIVNPFISSPQSCFTPTVNVPMVSTIPSTLTIVSHTAASPPSSSEIADTHSEINQTLYTTEGELESAGSQTSSKPEPVVNDETKSTVIESILMSVETKIPPSQQSQAMVIPFSKAQEVCVSPTSTVDVSVVSTAPSIPIVESAMSVSSMQGDTLVSSVENNVSSPHKSQTPIASFTKIEQVCVVPTKTVDDPVIPSAPSISTIASSTMSVITASSKQKHTSISSVETKICSPQESQTILAPFSEIQQAYAVPKPAVDNSTVSVATSTSTIESSTTSIMTMSTVKVDTSVSSFDTITSSMPSFSPIPLVPCPTNTTDTVITTEHLKSQHSFQKLSLEPDNDKQLQKATVKPQVLTHVIDGFIIYESFEPFPVSQSPILNSLGKVLPTKIQNSSKIRKDTPTGSNQEMRTLRARRIVELAKCEFCGEFGPNFRYKYSKRFCTKSCVKKFEKHTPKHVGIPASVIQEHVASGRRGRKRKLSRGRKCLQKQSLVEDENRNATASKEIISTPENESIVTYKTEEDDAAPSSANLDEKVEPKPDLSQNLPSEWASFIEGENTNATPSEQPLSIPENVSTVSYESTEGSSAPSSIPMEVVESNNEVGKSKSDLSQKLPSKWTVQDVFEFIQNVPGCSEYADNFKIEEIDGQALLLLNDNHLRTALCMKLGPALKLLSQVKSMEERLQLCLT